MKDMEAMSIEPLGHHCHGDALPWRLESPLRRYPAGPLVDADAAWVPAPAVSDLAAARCPVFAAADSLADLHATVSSHRQGADFVPDVVDNQSHPNRTAALVERDRRPSRGHSCSCSASLPIPVTNC